MICMIKNKSYAHPTRIVTWIEKPLLRTPGGRVEVSDSEVDVNKC